MDVRFGQVKNVEAPTPVEGARAPLVTDGWPVPVSGIVDPAGALRATLVESDLQRIAQAVHGPFVRVIRTHEPRARDPDPNRIAGQPLWDRTPKFKAFWDSLSEEQRAAFLAL